MSYIHPIGTSPDPSTSFGEGSNQGDDGLQTAVASPSTPSGLQESIIQNSNTHLHHGGSSNNSSTTPSPSLNRNPRRLSPAESYEGLGPVDHDLDAFNENACDNPQSPSSSAGHAGRNLRRQAQVHQQPAQPTLSDVSNTSNSKVGSSSAVSPAGPLKIKCGELRKKQEDIQIHDDGPPRPPEASDVPQLSMKIVDPVQPVESCIILMHSLYNTEASLKGLVQKLRSKQPESAFILLRGLEPVDLADDGYHWADPNGMVDGGFINTSRVLLEDVIRDGLMAKCRFHPRDIVVLGHGQGGMAALAATATWNCVEFGGVVSLGGPTPAYVQLEPNIKAKTPTLIYGSPRGDITPTALQQIQENFSFTDRYDPPSGDDRVPLSDVELAPLLEFIAHRLRREEWKRQAVLSLDGGGIRGYGSLLILQELMNKIGDREKQLDGTTESSFSPFDYEPTAVKPENASGGSAIVSPTDPSEPSDASAVGATSCSGLQNSALFLPCHYFTYAAGSSTGGLISIMLSRFRMTVDDCIEEYKTLGKKIFGRPRRIARGGFPWHRFSARVLEDVIRDVTSRHYIQSSDFSGLHGMERTDEDMSQCIVLAIASHSSGEYPYLFRTYEAQAPPFAPGRSRMHPQQLRNVGSAAMLPIWEVARATSAAPGYFPEIKIKTGNGSEVIKVKDGSFGTNNPSEEAYKDILNKHGGIMHMGPFISIGTGITKLDMFPKRSDNLSTLITNAKATIKLASRTFKADENMSYHANPDGIEQFPYFRFDGGPKLGEVDLGEWESHRLTRVTGKPKDSGHKTLDKIKTAVAVYLQNREVQARLKECAEILVKRRRLRTRNVSDWDRFASYSHYKCDIRRCEKRWANTAHDFKEHLRTYHKIKLADPVIESKIKQCRHVKWLYMP